MVVDPTKPTRAELQSITGNDHRMLVAFERLFDLVGEADLDNTSTIAVPFGSYGLQARMMCKTPFAEYPTQESAEIFGEY